jgi:serine/threonine-protein kinase
MSTNQPEPAEEQFNSLLANYEEARRAGATPPRPSKADLPPELQQELERDLACADLLHQVLRPPGPDTGPDLAKTGDFTGEPSPAAGAEPAGDLPWTSLGRFQLRRELGRGTFGIVYLAYDPGLSREVALKVPRLDVLADPQLRERFQREARAAAGLDHPQVVPVYEAGEVGPVCYIASAYCPGPTLAQWLKQRDQPVPVREAATLVALLADGVQHAHTRGVVHRDLKPANVLLAVSDQRSAVSQAEARAPSGPTAESTLLDATPRIADFGLAKILLEAGEASPTQSGAIVGTAEYMAPEQAGGKRQELGPAADIYALGVILYELLTGRPPLQAETALETLLLVRSEDPLPPGRLRPKLPRDLETICLKCLQKEPRKRYASAQALGDDLRRFLAGEQVQARPTPAWVRGLKWAKRRPAAAALLLVSAVALLALGGLGGTWAWWQERTERLEGERRADAERARLAVAAALAQAERLQGQALWAEAEAALDKAAGLAGAAGLEPQLLQARANLELSKHLDAAELDSAAVVDGQFNHAGAAQAYAATFRKHGLEVGAAPEEVLAQRIAASPIKKQLLAALDNWAYTALMIQDAKTQALVLAIARRADPDKWRDRLRDPAVWKDRQRLKRLAAEVKVDRESPALLKNLDHLLAPLGNDTVVLLEQAQHLHPQDFWLSFSLANALNSVLNNQKVGRLEEAVGYYRVALALRPGTPVVYNNLGTALQAQGDWSGAMAAFQKAIALDPRLAMAHANLGIGLYKKKDWKGAIAACNRALALDPKNAPAYNTIGGALFGKEDWPEAVVAFERAITLNPKYAMPHANLGFVRYHKKDWSGAIDACKRAIDLDPKYALAYNNLGLVHLAQKQLAEAIAAFQQATLLDPKLAEAHANLGTAFKDQGNLPRAVDACRKAIALGPKNPAFHYNLGNAFQAKKEWEQAIAAYKKAIELDPKHFNAYNNLGSALGIQGDVQGAIACYKEAIELDPKSAEAWANLGYALYNKGALPEAIDACNQAIALDPKYAQAYNHLGLALEARRDFQKAIAAYQKAIALEPKLALPHNNRGNALLAVGDLQGAIAAFHKAINLDPKFALAHSNLGAALYEQGDVKGAITCYKKALDLDPKFAPFHINLGQALETKGDLDQASAAYHKGNTLAPGLANGRVGLGRVLLRQGRFAAAHATSREALELLPTGHPLRPLTLQQLRQSELLLKLDGKLPAVLQGDVQPADAKEELDLADLCQRYKKRYAAAVRFYQSAFAAGAALTSQRAYNAACAAVLAAGGKGEDAVKLEAKEKSRLRQQAREWLRDALTSETERLEDADAKTRKAVQQSLQHWQQDADLASVRDPKALEQLPKAERVAWQQFWDEVEVLLGKISP